MMKRVLLMILFLMTLAFPVIAEDLQSVESLLKERTEAVLDILQDRNLDEEAKKKQVLDIVGPIIDFQLMAKLTLGKSGWAKLNGNQRIEFVDLFVNRLEKSYLDKSSMYCCVEIFYKPAIADGNKVYIPIEVKTEDNPLELLYKFYSSREGWKAYDVEVNGISLIKSYQAQFSEILKNGTAEDLLSSLGKPQEE